MENWAENTLNLFKNRIAPVRLTIEITSRCNYNCIHCYHASHNSINELSLEEILNVVDQFKKLGLFHVTITGGEPFIRQDLSDLLDELEKRHLKIELYTNASLINENTIELLKKSCISGVQISIYGATEKTYNAITNTNGNFTKFIRALDLLTKNDIPTKASIILLKPNFHEFDEMVKLCEEHGFKIQYGIQMLNNRDNKTMKDIEITIEQKVDFIHKVTHRGDFNVSKDCNDRKNDYICTAGVKGYNLTNTGDITPCTGYYRPLGNIRKNSIVDILNGSEATEIRNTRIKDINKCSQCSMLEHCSICPGYIYSENKTVKNFSESLLCLDTQNIIKAFNE